MKICGIYKITNIATGKIYIGSSVNMRVRWLEHKNTLRKNKHKNIYLQRAYNKDGIDNFVYECIQLSSVDTLIDDEQFWLDYFKNLGNKCYNIGPCVSNPATGRPAWNRGIPHSKETIDKIRIKSLGRPSKRIGMKHSEETKKKFRNAWIERRKKEVSTETRRKLSESHKGHSTWNKLSLQKQEEVRNKLRIANTGKTLTAEHVAKLVEAQKYVINPARFKKGQPNLFQGKKHTEEAKLKMRLAKLGKKLSEAHKQALSEAQKRRYLKTTGEV